MRVPEIFAHRGFSARYSENSLPAFEAAVQAGANGVETDLQLTADERILLFHDDRAGKLGHPALAIHERDGVFWKNPRFAGTPPAFLTDLLPLISADFLLMAEIKSAAGISDAQRHLLVEKALDELAPLDPHHFMILSFDLEILSWVHQSAPNIRTVLNCEIPPTDNRPLQDLYALSPDIAILDGPLVENVRRQGLALATWTINTPRQLARALECQVDYVLGDDPDWLRDALGG